MNAPSIMQRTCETESRDAAVGGTLSTSACLAWLGRQCVRARWQTWERLRGIDTRGSLSSSVLGNGADRYGYQPIDYAALSAGLRHAGITANDVFLDYGCGKGRALMVAAACGFRRVLGVELSPELCRVARRNLERATRSLTAAWQVYQEDATSFEVPDDVTHIHMFNPFTGAVLRECLKRIRSSLDRRPRGLSILYGIPVTDHDALADESWLERVTRVRTASDHWLRLTLYRAIGEPLCSTRGQS